MADSDPNKWDYPPHTRAKHDMLASYLGGWFPILGSWAGRVVFLDGFAGRGRYVDGSEGSPLVALRCLVEHSYFANLRHRQFVFIFVEADRDNAANLGREIEAFKAKHADTYGGWPANVLVQIEHAPFDQTAAEILRTLREQKAKLAPTFAFVDPFGYSGLPMDLLAELLSYKHTELFVNFMVGHVQRFITRDRQQAPMRSLFGKDVSEVLEGFDPDHGDRVSHLHNVYADQLRQRIGLDYVNSFGMINRTGNIGYYLYHGTRDKKGVKLMKAAMWKIDPGGGYTFSDRLAGVDVLFTPEPDLAPLRKATLEHFRGRREVRVDEIEWFAVLQTPYRETHVRPVLTQLETERQITVIRTGRSRTAFPVATTTISFS